MQKVAREILSILNRCAAIFTFPALDNGYIYLAATRLNLYRSPADWALVIEVFGYSPRSDLPHTDIYTFASRLCGRDNRIESVSLENHAIYLANNPNNESSYVYPIEEGPWQDPDDPEMVWEGASQMIVRGKEIELPRPERYVDYGIDLEDSPTVAVFEACRFLAAVQRDLVLATEIERRVNIPDELEQILQLEEWNHPDLIGELARPSDSETFQQLAAVLESGDTDLYQPSIPPNTHWKNWPEGGTL